MSINNLLYVLGRFFIMDFYIKLGRLFTTMINIKNRLGYSKISINSRDKSGDFTTMMSNKNKIRLFKGLFILIDQTMGINTIIVQEL